MKAVITLRIKSGFLIVERDVDSLTPEEVKRIGAKVGGRTLYFGGILFGIAGLAMLLGFHRYLPMEFGYLLMGFFIIFIVLPVIFYSWKEEKGGKKIRKGNN